MPFPLQYHTTLFDALIPATIRENHELVYISNNVCVEWEGLQQSKPMLLRGRHQNSVTMISFFKQKEFKILSLHFFCRSHFFLLTLDFMLRATEFLKLYYHINRTVSALSSHLSSYNDVLMCFLCEVWQRNQETFIRWVFVQKSYNGTCVTDMHIRYRSHNNIYFHGIWPPHSHVHLGQK